MMRSSGHTMDWTREPLTQNNKNNSGINLKFVIMLGYGMAMAMAMGWCSRVPCFSVSGVF